MAVPERRSEPYLTSGLSGQPAVACLRYLLRGGTVKGSQNLASRFFLFDFAA